MSLLHNAAAAAAAAVAAAAAAALAHNFGLKSPFYARVCKAFSFTPCVRLIVLCSVCLFAQQRRALPPNTHHKATPAERCTLRLRICSMRTVRSQYLLFSASVQCRVLQRWHRHHAIFFEMRALCC
jgi:hypothetical protein